MGNAVAHHQWMPRILLVLIVLVCSVACTRESRVEGDVFVVTNGAQNYKLGLVEVRFIPSSEFHLLVGRQAADARVALGLLKTKMLLVDAGIGTAQMQIDADLPRQTRRQMADWMSLMERAASAGIKSTFDKASAQYAELSLELRNQEDERDSSEKELKRLLDERRELQRKIRRIRDGVDAVSSMQSSLTSKTDADGKFVVTLPRGEYVLAATASRQVGEDVEDYAWAVRLVLDGESQHVMLSNDNLSKTECRDCVLREFRSLLLSESPTGTLDGG